MTNMYYMSLMIVKIMYQPPQGTVLGPVNGPVNAPVNAPVNPPVLGSGMIIPN